MNKIILGDSIKIIKDFSDNWVHLILSDIPYGISKDEWDVLHNNSNSSLLGSSPSQKKAGTVFKSRGKPLNGWSEADKNISHEYYDWCMTWSRDWLRILKPGGSCFVFAGRRYAHRCICALEDAGFIFKDMLCWQKETAPHRAQRVSEIYNRRKDFENAKKWEGWKVGNLRPIFEPILWFMKPYKIGGTLADNIIENGIGAYNEYKLKEYSASNPGMSLCSNIIKVKTSKTDRGLHPTQKPIELMKILIDLTTTENQIVLDPFCGCGTTLAAAKQLNRQYIGIEKNEEYFRNMELRLNGEKPKWGQK